MLTDNQLIVHQPHNNRKQHPRCLTHRFTKQTHFAHPLFLQNEPPRHEVARVSVGQGKKPRSDLVFRHQTLRRRASR
jgi:hypothetical protein